MPLLTSQLENYFSKCRYYFFQVLEADTFLLTFSSTLVSGICLSLMFTPFDVVSTRLYNQGVNEEGKGLFYRGYMHCFYKIYKTEGILGFYKGIVPSFVRLVPHTILCLTFWDSFNRYFNNILWETNIRNIFIKTI